MATGLDSNQISTDLVNQFNQNVYGGVPPTEVSFSVIDLAKEVLASGFQFLSTPFIWLFDIIVYFVIFPLLVIAFIVFFLAIQYLIVRLYYWLFVDVILNIEIVRTILTDLGFTLAHKNTTSNNPQKQKKVEETQDNPVV